MANELMYRPEQTNDEYFQFSSGPDGNGFAGVGYDSNFNGLGPATELGAIRFNNVAVSQGTSVNQALLYLKVDTRHGSSNVLARVYGFDEDTISDFGGGIGGLALTTANNTVTYSSGSYLTVDVTSIVNEIFARAGWASGNDLGLKIEDNGTSTASTNRIYDTYDGALSSDSFLAIRISTEPNFFPTPTTVSAPTFPAHDRFGIKISKPGVNVLTATDEEVYFTTWKDVFKVSTENTASCTADTVKTVAHGLGYVPQVLAYCRAGGKSVKLPRFPLSTDPITGGARGYAYADSTNTYFLIDQTADVYYYIFIDEQAT